MKTESSPSSRKGIPSKMKGQKMPPRAQIIRLARIASLLKTNSCPSAEKIIEEYREIELEEGKNIKGKYSRRTVFRDIAVLRDEYGCPIKYNWGEKRYELLDPKWEFNCPAYRRERSSPSSSSPALPHSDCRTNPCGCGNNPPARGSGRSRPPTGTRPE